MDKILHDYDRVFRNRSYFPSFRHVGHGRCSSPGYCGGTRLALASWRCFIRTGREELFTLGGLLSGVDCGEVREVAEVA